MGTIVAASRDSGNGHFGGRRVIPTSVAPIAFFVRDDADWMAATRAPG